MKSAKDRVAEAVKFPKLKGVSYIEISDKLLKGPLMKAVCGVFMAITFTIGFFIGAMMGSDQGRIDVASGKVSMVLVTAPDKTTHWEVAK